MQMDLFGLMAKPLNLAPIARVATARERGIEWGEWWDEQKALTAAGTFERITWGNPKTRQGNLVVDLWHGKPGWRWTLSYETPTAGGCGQLSFDIYETRNAAMLAAFRDKLQWCARELSGCYGRSDSHERAVRDMAAWMITNCNPMNFGGVKLAEEFDELCKAARAREVRRGKALCAAHEASNQAAALFQKHGFWGYSGSGDSGLIRNEEVKEWGGKGVDPIGHAKAWPAHWVIGGHSPGALKLIFYPTAGQSQNPALVKALELAREHLPFPVELVDEGWSYPMDRWTWDEDGTGE